MNISVLITTYNRSHSLQEILADVAAQKLAPDIAWEVIVADNRSQDDTISVVEKIAKKFPVALWYLYEEKPGKSYALNTGIVAAKGEIIANIDADCLPDPDWLATGAKHFKNKNVVAVSGPYDYYDTDKFFRHTSLFIQKHIYRAMGHVLQLPFIKKGAVLIGGNNFIRAEIINKAGGYNTDLVFYGEDTDTAKRVSKHGYAVFDPKLTMKTSGRRFRNEGTLSTFARYLFHFVKIIFSK